MMPARPASSTGPHRPTGPPPDAARPAGRRSPPAGRRPCREAVGLEDLVGNRPRSTCAAVMRWAPTSDRAGCPRASPSARHGWRPPDRRAHRGTAGAARADGRRAQRRPGRLAGFDDVHLAEGRLAQGIEGLHHRSVQALGDVPHQVRLPVGIHRDDRQILGQPGSQFAAVPPCPGPPPPSGRPARSVPAGAHPRRARGRRSRPTAGGPRPACPRPGRSSPTALAATCRRRAPLAAVVDRSRSRRRPAGTSQRRASRGRRDVRHRTRSLWTPPGQVDRRDLHPVHPVGMSMKTGPGAWRSIAARVGISWVDAASPCTWMARRVTGLKISMPIQDLVRVGPADVRPDLAADGHHPGPLQRTPPPRSRGCGPRTQGSDAHAGARVTW